MTSVGAGQRQRRAGSGTGSGVYLPLSSAADDDDELEGRPGRVEVAGDRAVDERARGLLEQAVVRVERARVVHGDRVRVERRASRPWRARRRSTDRSRPRRPRWFPSASYAACCTFGSMVSSHRVALRVLAGHDVLDPVEELVAARAGELRVQGALDARGLAVERVVAGHRRVERARRVLALELVLVVDSVFDTTIGLAVDVRICAALDRCTRRARARALRASASRASAWKTWMIDDARRGPRTSARTSALMRFSSRFIMITVLGLAADGVGDAQQQRRDDPVRHERGAARGEEGRGEARLAG